MKMKNGLSTKIVTIVLSCSIYMISPIISASNYVYDYIGRKVHKLKFGGEGIDIITATPPSSCASLSFSSVKLDLKKRRYGQASIIERPHKHCKSKCLIKVKWKHKAAGLIEYNLQVKWIKTSKRCK